MPKFFYQMFQRKGVKGFLNNVKTVELVFLGIPKRKSCLCPYQNVIFIRIMNGFGPLLKFSKRISSFYGLGPIIFAHKI